MAGNIIIIAVGKIKEKYLRDGINEYLRRLKNYTNLEITEISDESIPDKLSLPTKQKILDKEGDKILSLIKDGDYLILLDLKGDTTDSEMLAKKIKTLEVSRQGRIVFAIGGSLGVSERLIIRADFRLCLSHLTFTHQIARFILTEQIYRAYNINNGGKYHR
ncbi:23S rRNA (pseudouridine1915-N3)-methyltransferase [Methanomicrobium sp. W14]|uniref:23S rRNA (pseudouridine(1915)-N(3))-methyltransferase RlmH n=1 Tax=Methanomicrobium sp. W14 TaxID=2817839 RepID=UPI001AE57334|nr:23S rRNA (pseudouridine(1915)-N(3))-methyltransferase RlmH [Methanomicrobium sp. W14]MBP2132931.1 23S rRNA (pseudouridine1915-N3)-methyltransferase [Methanomicrobium sp. W14]